MKARVIRGVYIKGKAYAEGSIVEVDGLTYAELRTTNYLEAAPAELERRVIEPPKVTPAAPPADESAIKK